jgi:signal transduction histidine kinase
MGVETGAPPGASAAEVELLRRRILNVIGHELRTPVTSLRGLVGELAAWPEGPVREELIAAVVRSAERVDRLVEDLLLACSVDTLVPVGPPQPVDLLAAARMAWAAVPLGPDAEFVGDAIASARPDAVARVLAALLDNAAVHGEPPVTITASMEEGRAVLEIANGGPALPPQDLSLALEAFYRGERAVTTRAGLGLGLALAATLARGDGGSVTLGPGVDGGVLARYELPAG